jgi:hypothetical protein
VFAEERFRAAGPLLCKDRLYPYSQPPRGSPRLYPGTGKPAEDAFDLRNPAERDTKPAKEERPRVRLVTQGP